MPPAPEKTAMRSVITGLLVGGLGFAAASVSPAPCHDKVVASQDSYVGDKLYRAGTEADLGVKPACSAGIGVGAGLVSAIVARQLFAGQARGRVQHFESAKSTYRDQLARWESSTANERETWLANNAQVKAAVAKQAADRERALLANEQIERRNAARGAPAVSLARITATTPVRP